MSKFTPGPWRTGKGAGSRYTVYDKFSQRVGDFFEGVMVTQRSNEECAANARLGAAAPELYDALRELLTDMVIAQGNMRKAAKRDPAWEGCVEIIQPRIDAARAAIAKAEGK